ncbi:hypothetical protein [Xanthobacter autotrophicus]|uniref:hypothetical protein n=1 Tax=Xanthobacter autotrophicus TaxID=280 RepID=UPI00372BD5C4
MTTKLKGRSIEDVPYTGLIEGLCQIGLICQIAGQTKDDLTKDDLMSLISQISEIGSSSIAFSGATHEEAKEVSEYLLSGMSVSHHSKN